MSHPPPKSNRGFRSADRGGPPQAHRPTGRQSATPGNPRQPQTTPGLGDACAAPSRAALQRPLAKTLIFEDSDLSPSHAHALDPGLRPSCDDPRPRPRDPRGDTANADGGSRADGVTILRSGRRAPEPGQSGARHHPGRAPGRRWSRQPRIRLGSGPDTGGPACGHRSRNLGATARCTQCLHRTSTRSQHQDRYAQIGRPTTTETRAQTAWPSPRSAIWKPRCISAPLATSAGDGSPHQ